MSRSCRRNLISFIWTILFLSILIHPISICASPTSYYWNIEEVGIPAAWEYTQGTPNIIVAVIDSGIDLGHPDLINSSWKNLGEISSNGKDDDGNGYVDDVMGWDFQDNDNNPFPPPNTIGSKHGTFIAGLIAADDDNDIFVGVAPNVKIMSLRFLRSDLSFTEDDWPKLVEAIDYAVLNGAKIINLSLEARGVPPIYVYESIRRAYEAGVIIVGVTGNHSGKVTYPGNYSEVIAVSAVTSSQKLAYFSGYGAENEICAPGKDVYSITGYNTSIVNGSGTSYAAPLVSGVIALMLSINPSLPIESIREILHDTSTDLGDIGMDPMYGYGLINASAALDELIADPLIYTLEGHSSHVWDIDIAQNDKILASVSSDSSIRIWDIDTGLYIKSLTGLTEPILCVVLHPKGDLLTAGSSDGNIYLWNVTSGDLIRSDIGHTASVLSLSISSSGIILASGSADGKILLWNVATGQILFSLTNHTDSVESVEFNPDDSLLASGSLDKTIKIWNTSNGEILHNLQNHTAGVLDVAFNPNGNLLASGSLDMTVKLWEVERGILKETLQGHSGSVPAVSFNYDGFTLASGSEDSTIVVWDVETTQFMLRILSHNSSVVSLSYTTTGQILVSSSTDGTIKLWNVTDIDFDGMSDRWERLYNLNPSYFKDRFEDPDNDNLMNFLEFVFGTNPRIKDTDGDLIPDDYEFQHLLNGNHNDSYDDKDADGMPNLYEYQNGLLAGFDDANKDLDYDGLSNLQEYTLGTDPRDFDTDDDGWNDGIEFQMGTDPLSSDSNPFTLIFFNLLPLASIIAVTIIFLLQLRKSLKIES